MAASPTTFLQLPPELGGLRFGPFKGQVVFGSDAKRSQIVLDPGHGVYPVHASMGLLDDGSYALSPATKECKLFVVPQGQPHVWPVTGPVQARAGDTIILGTPSGPRFQIQQEGVHQMSVDQVIDETRAAGGEQGVVHGVNRLMSNVFKPQANTILGEIARRAQAQMLAKPGPARTAYFLWTRFRSGQLFTPYYLVGMAVGLVGLMGTGAVSCSGVMYIILDALGIGR
jgi:hypothetical protein